MWACQVGRDREEWAAIIIPVHVSGSVVVSVRGWRWKPGGWLGLLALWGASSQGRGSKTSNWTTAGWMEKCWGSKLSPFHWVEFLYCAIVLKQEEVAPGCEPAYDFIIIQTSSPSPDSHIIVNYFVLFHTCFSAAVVSTSICDQFVQFMCHKLVCVLKEACVFVSYWVSANRLSAEIPQIPLGRSQW